MQPVRASGPGVCHCQPVPDLRTVMKQEVGNQDLLRLRLKELSARFTY